MNLTESFSRAGDTRSAQIYLAKCRQLPANAFSVLRWLHLDKLETIVAFECLDFDAARAALQSALGRVQSAGRVSSKLVIQIMFDFLAMEDGQLDALRVLAEADLRQLPHNAQLTELNVRLFFYRIRYFSARGQWWLALNALQQAAELLERSPNSIWRALLYEACCFALLARREWRVCRVLLGHSRKSLAAANADPSPRQTRNWTCIESALDAAPDRRSVHKPLAPIAWRVSDRYALPQLLQCMQDLLTEKADSEAAPPFTICLL